MTDEPFAPIENEADLEERLSRPTEAVRQTLSGLSGDLLVLGVGGKMGPTLARMAARAFQETGSPNRVVGVSRFSQSGLAESLEAAGVRTVQADLLDRQAVSRLPDAPNVVFMAGMKFGSTGAEALAWAMNAHLPALVAERYRDSRIVAFSSGNVYPFMPLVLGGATEATPPAPVGEYAQSVLARERIFEYFSRRHGTPVAVLRLNYAVELRYGVLLDVARKVHEGAPVDLSMGNVNVLWQGDANAYALRSLACCASPPFLLNVAGPETLSVRRLVIRFGDLLEREPVFSGEESPSALLNDAGKAFGLFGYPSVSTETVLRWVAVWLRSGGSTLDKPTHFETRDGKF